MESPTSKLPSVELLESTHTFPTNYTFKVIGKADDAFLARVLTGARRAAELEQDPEFTVRQTSNGKHVAVTLSVPSKDAPSVLKVYRELIDLPGLVLLM